MFVVENPMHVYSGTGVTISDVQDVDLRSAAGGLVPCRLYNNGPSAVYLGAAGTSPASGNYPIPANAYAPDRLKGTVAMRAAVADLGVTWGSSTNTTAGVLGVKQVWKIQVTHAVDGAGTVAFTLTSANVAGTPLDFNTVFAGAATVDEAATAIAAAMAGTAAIADDWDVAADDDYITGTSTREIANDATVNLVVKTDGDSTNIALGSISIETDGVLAVKQVETIQCTHAATAAGTLIPKVTMGGVVYTADGVAIASGDAAATIAENVKDSLNANASISAAYVATRSTDSVVLTAKDDAANDDTLAMDMSTYYGTAVVSILKLVDAV